MRRFVTIMIPTAVVGALFLIFLRTGEAATPKSHDQFNALVLTAKSSLLLRLKEELYDTRVPPSYPAWTNVLLSIWPTRMQRTHDEKETIRVNTWMQVTWHDARLQWDATKFVSADTTTAPSSQQNATNLTFSGKHTVDNGNLRAGCGIAPPLPMRIEEIWTPYISVYEMTWTASMPSEFVHQEVTVRCDGRVRMTGMFVDDTHCFMHTRYFPFDKQACPLTYYVTQRVMLQHRVRYSTEEDFKNVFNEASYETGDWQMFVDLATINRTFNRAEVQIYENYGESYLTYTFILQRKPFQHVLDWVVPPIVLSTSSLVAMYLGCERSERYSFGGTVVVTLTLMLSSFREDMPVALDGYPILATLYLGLLGTNIMATMLCALPEYFNEVGRRWKRESTRRNFDPTDDEGSQRSRVGKRILLAHSKMFDQANHKTEIPTVSKIAKGPRSWTTLKQTLNWRSTIGAFLHRSTESLFMEVCLMLVFLSIQIGIIGWAAYQWNWSFNAPAIQTSNEPPFDIISNLESSDDLF